MTTIAITEGFKICQSFLGNKVHNAKDPSRALGPMFKQVVGTLFFLMTQYEDKWRSVEWSRPTAIYGFRSEVHPEPVHVRVRPLIEKFRIGVRENKDCWYSVLPRERVEELENIAALSLQDFKFPVETWVKVVYDFAVAYKNGRVAASSNTEGIVSRLISSLVPVYFGRTASFVKETKHIPTFEAEHVTEHLCAKFEEMKPYLIQRWFNGGGEKTNEDSMDL